jgi:polyhydroxyalkanoate synthase
VAKRDHIVPLASATPLGERVGSADKQQIVLDAGHVGIVAGRGAVKELWPRVASWLIDHSSPARTEVTA